MMKTQLTRKFNIPSLFNWGLIGTLLVNISNAYGADVSTRLELQHRLDYQVPLTYATFIGTHNSYNASDWGYPYPNHRRDPIDQLNAGFRVINYDVHTLDSILSPSEHLCHMSSDSSLTCSPLDNSFSYGLEQLNSWLENNPGEVVLLVLEDYINDRRHDESAADISSKIGNKVYKPNADEKYDAGMCYSLPLSTLTKQQVLDAGKQLIIVESRACSTYATWESWVWAMTYQAYYANEYKNSVTRFDDKWGFVYEDRSIWGDIGEKILSADEIEEALNMGAAVLGLDMALSIDRRENAIWSWNTNEPNNANGNEDCAEQMSSGRWNDVPCSRSYRYACQSADDGSWMISQTSGNWSGGEDACQSLGGDYFFSVPVNANDNVALNTARQNAGNPMVWLNYTDQATEGDWVALHRWNSPHSSYWQELPGMISLRGAHGKYAVAEQSGAMNANSTNLDSEEQFTVFYHSDGSLSLQSNYDKFASAELNGNLVADRDEMGPWEKFYRVNNSDGTVSLRSLYGKYMVAESTGAMNANRNEIGSWEKFDLITYPQPEPEVEYVYGNKVWGSSSGYAFDDITALNNGLLQGEKVNIFKIGLRSGNRVDQVSIEYDNGQIVRHGGDGGGAKTTSALPPTTTLQKVEVCKAYTAEHNSTTVHYIKFTLSDGETLEGGIRNGDCTTLRSVSNGYPILGFRGSSGDELDSIGVIFEKPVITDL